jgi:hypothetical protein
MKNPRCKIVAATVIIGLLAGCSAVTKQTADIPIEIYVTAEAMPQIPVLTDLPAGCHFASSAGKQISEPRPRFRVQPVIKNPSSAVAPNATFDFLIAAIVNPDGSVRRVYIIHSSDPRTNTAMIDAVQKWTFVPGVVDGKRASFVYFTDYRLERRSITRGEVEDLIKQIEKGR